MPVDAFGMQYFWYMLPYAVPGFITFIVGVLLCLLGLLRLTKRERIGYYLSFSGSCLGFGMLGLVLALRAIIREETILLQWNTYLYPFVLFGLPSSFYLIYYILKQKYRILLWVAAVNWLTVIVALIGIGKGIAFTGEFLHYSFGIYPVASLYLKPWGIISALSYFLFVVPSYFYYLRQNSFREKSYLVVGHNLLALLMISNLPSFVGIPIFPGSTLSFIPMLILAYGVFNTDFRDIKQLLFEKSGLFYILNIFVGLILLAAAGSVLFLLSPMDFEKLNWYPWLLIPLFSIFAVVGLGIFIGGTNPNKPLNQLGAFALYLYGFQLFTTITVSISPDPLIGRRIGQLCYIIFCLGPSIQLRFAFLSMDRPLPKLLPIFDLASVLMSAMAMSPYLFHGYYEFLWGRYTASGPVLQVFGVVGFLMISAILREWWLCRKIGQQNPLGNFAVLYICIGGLLLLCNFPATMGFEIYPMGNLSIVPTGILAFAVLRYGGENIKTEARRISFYLLPFALIPIILFIFYIWNTQPKDATISSRYLHLLLSGISLTLLGFLATFVLIRPIASRIDRAFLSLEEQRKIAEIRKQEIEDLNNFTHIANSQTELGEIFTTISKYVYSRFFIIGAWLFLPDEISECLYVYKVYSYNKLPEEQYNYLMNKKLPMNEKEGGVTYKTFQRKTPFYLRRIPKFKFEVDKEMANTLSMKSLFLVPLVRKDKSVGILGFSNFEKEMKFSKNEIKNLFNLCSQIAGAIDTNHLLRQVEKEQKETEKQKNEIEKLNKILRRINSVSSLTDVMTFVMFHLEKDYKFSEFWMLLKDDASNFLYTFTHNAPRASLEGHEFFKNFKISLDEESLLCSTFKEQKILYMPLDENASISAIDRQIIEKGNLNYILQMPFVVYDETIGILCLHDKSSNSITEDMLSKLQNFSNQVAGSVSNSKLFKIVQDEKEKALIAQQEEMIAKQEVATLNYLSKEINTTSDLNLICKIIFSYISVAFDIENILILNINERTNEFSDFLFKGNLPEEKIEKLKMIKTPLNSSTGALFRTYQKKKYLYIPRLNLESVKSEFDKKLVNMLQMNSFFHVPLIVLNKVIAVAILFNRDKPLNLSKNNRTKIMNAMDQIAGAFANSRLLKETEEAKIHADIEKGIAVVAQAEAEKERQKSEKLLLNILPKDVASELKEKGYAEPIHYESVSVLFTDFKGFTLIAEKLSPNELLSELDACFVQFDKITERYNLEKLKTIGDSYMCAGGIPRKNPTHAVDSILAAIEIQSFMNAMREMKEMVGLPFWELRLGIHSGPLVAGVIGEKKFAYDVWGDTVNTASRMESSGTPGRINISGATYELVKDFFDCEFRGMVKAKNKGDVAMYYVNGIKENLYKHLYESDSEFSAIQTPNGKFWEMYSEL